MNKKRRQIFDSKCYDLAEHFLPVGVEDEIKCELAQIIQNAVESYLEIDELDRGDVVSKDSA